ncbi:MAG: cache domain-containing protein, partial [Burkholderiales bacterium]|nr:cache domain-containing protein [Burkholderiales bacterium]
MQSLLDSFSIRTKLIVLLLLGALGVALAVTVALREERQVMLDDRKAKTQHVVETGMAVLQYFETQAKTGKMSREEAQRQAAASLRDVRYGGTDYFWINDLDRRVIMHPMKPEWEGTVQDQVRDPDGVYTYREFAKMARDNGAGFVAYRWNKLGGTEPVPKLSYVKLFEP